MRLGGVLAVCGLLLLLAHLVLAGKDYYATLGLKRDATERQIKKAYRTLSKELHPDKNREDPQAQEKFMAVANAYEVLTDKEKRRIYDQHGEEGLKQQGGGAQRDPFDLFSQFGFGGFGQQQQRQEDQRGDDVTIELHASLEDLYNGRATEVSVKKQVLCPKCRGSGAKSEDDVKTCPVCKGKGVTITMQQLGPGFVQQIQNQCSRCGGKGKIVSSVCPHCSGKKVVGGEQVLDVFVEQGMADAQTISFENAGDERPDKAAGHINFKIKTLPHKHFRRSGNDLHYTIHISLLESLVGFTKHVTHLDGHKVKLERDRVTEHGHVMVVRGEGMPHYGYASKKGDLHVKYIVDFPKKLTDQQRKGFGEILK